MRDGRIRASIPAAMFLVPATRQHSVRTRRGRMLLLAASALTCAPTAYAAPVGGQVTAGTGGIQQGGNITTVNQSSQHLSLSWQGFNTNASETVNFVQPSASAIAVNRILDTNGTRFMGKLNANGQVYLINPNGVLFGASAQINVGGLVASTLDLDDAALNNGTRRFSGTGTGSIVNQGAITTAQGGYVAFIGNSVSNQGNITAPEGSVALGAGSDVTLSFAGNSLLSMQVNQSTINNLAENGGLIQADGGAVILTAGAKDAVLASVVNNSGVVQARSVQNLNGTIVLGGEAQSTVTNSGTLNASGTPSGQTGGTVKVLGGTVTLAAGSKIDVSGDAGGGTALVGGNFLGSGPELNAGNTNVAAGATVVADAITAGKGGQVAIWSDGLTQFDGAISARGGQAGGDGGQIETSGHMLKVGTSAAISTLAPNGTVGSWLLDPQDFTIGSYPGEGDITYDQLTSALQASDVTIKTGPSATCLGAQVSCGAGTQGQGDINLADGVFIGGSGWTSGTTLTLSAYHDINFRDYATIDASGNSTPGVANNIVLRAGNSGNGSGTVNFGQYNYISGSQNGSVKIYYNPSSYSTPTPFASMNDGAGTPTIFDPFTGNPYANLSTYMLVNFAANIGSKTYDGTTTATLSGLTVLGGAPAGIAIDASHATATFLDKNVGVGKSVTISGIVLTGANAGAYALNGLDKTGTIIKADLTVSGVVANNKVYDGTTAATLSGTASVSAFAGDSVAVHGSGTASFADKNAGTSKSVIVSGYTLSGADAGNYNVVQPSGLMANIGRADLAVTGVTANDKTYDRTTAATLGGNPTVAAFGSDVVSVSGLGSASASFADKNAGSGKLVTVTGFTMSGTDAGNYNLVQPSGLVGAIRKADLLLSGLAVSDKIYDATTSATLYGSAGVTPIAGDDVSLSGQGSAVFANKNAGAGKAVNVSGFTLSGADAANYNLLQVGGLTANIGKADLELAGVGVANKTYDGSTSATLQGSPYVTPIGDDLVSVSGTGTAVFLDKNVGTGKHVSVGGFTLSGADAANYNLVAPAGLTGNVATADLFVTGITVDDKTYDGNPTATLSGTPTVAKFGSDEVTVSGLNSASASFADKNAATGKLVTIGGFTLSGIDAANYNPVQPGGLRANIRQANLVLGGLSVSDKFYDATTTATLSGSASISPIVGDDVALSGTGTAAFVNKNAGLNKAVTISGYSLSGLDAGNYNLVQVGGLTANIARADLPVMGVTAENKVYNGNRIATLSGAPVVAALGSDVVALSGVGSGEFADKNAGSGKLVTVSGYTLTGVDAANYNVVQPTGLTADITKADLAVTGVSASNKTYDGGLGATLYGTPVVAAFGADAVSVTGSASASFADKNAGGAKAVTVTGYALSGLDAGNYTIVQPTGLVASIARANLAVTGLSVADKTYDRSTAATLNGTATVSAIGTDMVSLTGTGTGTFADRNAGVGKLVTVGGYTLTGIDAGNYILVQPSGLAATIFKADLAVTGLSAADRVYDGSTAATLTGAATVAPLGSDAVSLAGTGSGSFATKNAGANKTVTVTGYTLTGTDAGNYSLVQPIGLSATILRAGLTLTGIAAGNKTYDGTTTATLTGTATVAAIGSDVVSVAGSGAGSRFDTKNVGTGKAVTVAGYTLAGTDAGNYTLILPTNLTADIGKADLAVSGVSAAGKVYDASAAATLSGTAAVAAFGGDVVTVTGTGIGTFADKNAGANKAVTVSGFTLSGVDATNYNLVQPTGLLASIDRADLAVGGLAALGKTYDGTRTASLSGVGSVSAIGNDDVTLAGTAAGSFADKNAGVAKDVTVSGLVLTGPDAGNYRLIEPAGLTANIAKADLAVFGVATNDKTYDATTAATLSGAAAVSALPSDAVALAGTGTAWFADKNVGTGKAVIVAGYTLTGADAANYTLVQPAGLTASIVKANLTLAGVSAENKAYDGTTAALLVGAPTVAAFGNDAVAVGGTGVARFADKTVGRAKPIAVSGYVLTGTDAGNYALVVPGQAADITPARLVVSGITAQDKLFDGTTAAMVSTANVVLAGKIGSDDVTVASAGAFSDATAGDGKTVNLTNRFGGADVGNYSIADQTVALASITPAPAAEPTVPDARVGNAVTQLQTSILSPRPVADGGASQADALVTASATQRDGDRVATAGTIDTSIGSGPTAPNLQIENGGMKLPQLATALTE